MRFWYLASLTLNSILIFAVLLLPAALIDVSHQLFRYASVDVLIIALLTSLLVFFIPLEKQAPLAHQLKTLRKGVSKLALSYGLLGFSLYLLRASTLTEESNATILRHVSNACLPLYFGSILHMASLITSPYSWLRFLENPKPGLRKSVRVFEYSVGLLILLFTVGSVVSSWTRTEYAESNLETRASEIADVKWAQMQKVGWEKFCPIYHTNAYSARRDIKYAEWEKLEWEERRSIWTYEAVADPWGRY